MATEFEPTVHTVDQPVEGIIARYDDYQSQVKGIAYWVGRDGVTSIEACQKNGEYCHLPYFRVWAGDQCLAEFGQHHLAGVFFAKKIPEQDNG